MLWTFDETELIRSYTHLHFNEQKIWTLWSWWFHQKSNNKLLLTSIVQAHTYIWILYNEHTKTLWWAAILQSLFCVYVVRVRGKMNPAMETRESTHISHCWLKMISFSIFHRHSRVHVYRALYSKSASLSNHLDPLRVVSRLNEKRVNEWKDKSVKPIRGWY